MTPRLWREVGLTSLVGALLAFALAIFFYHRAGNVFSWQYSFISDLVTTKDLLGQNQPVVRLLAALGFLGVSITTVSVIFWKTSHEVPSRTEKLSRDLVIILAVVFFAIALTPSDVHRTLHRLLLAGTITLLSVIWPIAFDRGYFPSRYTRVLCHLTTFALWAYLAFIIIAPRPDTSVAASSLHAQLEKLVFIIVLYNIYSLFTARGQQKPQHRV